MSERRYRHRITLQALAPTQTESGAEVEAWGDVRSCWAEVTPLSGREYFAARQTQSDVTHSIRIRYWNGVLPSMRVLFKGRVLDIQSAVNVEERGKEIEMMCVEKVGEDGEQA